MVAGINPIVAALQKQLTDHPINTCSFMRHWSSGRATREDFVAWMRVQLCASVSFGWSLKRIEVGLPKPLCLAEEYRRFSALAQIEWWPSWAAGSHGEHFKKLASFLGFQVDVAGAFDACPAHMRTWLEFREGLAERYGPEAALLTLAVANEVGNLKFFKELEGALKTIPGLEGCPPDYVEAHLEDEGPDARIMIELAKLLMKGRGKKEYERLHTDAADATQRFLDLRLAALEEAYTSFPR